MELRLKKFTRPVLLMDSARSFLDAFSVPKTFCNFVITIFGLTINFANYYSSISEVWSWLGGPIQSCPKDAWDLSKQSCSKGYWTNATKGDGRSWSGSPNEVGTLSNTLQPCGSHVPSIEGLSLPLLAGLSCQRVALRSHLGREQAHVQPKQKQNQLRPTQRVRLRQRPKASEAMSHSFLEMMWKDYL